MFGKDIKGYYCKYHYLIKMYVLRLIWTRINNIRNRIIGIKTGKNCRYYGYTYFYRKLLSTILIGNNCGFRSLFHSNLIGINRKCSISTLLKESEIIIGDNCGFSGTIIGAAKRIKIGNNVRCGANTLITDNDWHLNDPRSSEPVGIIIENNVWLGVNVVVLKGVIIGENSVIGANSVVVKDIPENVIAAGNPCKVIKKFDELF